MNARGTCSTPSFRHDFSRNPFKLICKQLILWMIRFAHPEGRPTGVQRAPRFCPAFAGMTYFGVLQEPCLESILPVSLGALCAFARKTGVYGWMLRYFRIVQKGRCWEWRWLKQKNSVIPAESLACLASVIIHSGNHLAWNTHSSFT